MDATGITRIAHLSDAHMLDPRPSRTRAGWSMQTRFLSFGRPLDAEGRRRKFRRALDTAQRVGAHHFVLSGDLTEVDQRPTNFAWTRRQNIRWGFDYSTPVGKAPARPQRPADAPPRAPNPKR